MNEEIILTMVRPYLKNKTLTYDEFDNIFSMLSHKEQYEVCEILFNNDISLVDTVLSKNHMKMIREKILVLKILKSYTIKICLRIILLLTASQKNLSLIKIYVNQMRYSAT